MRIIFLLLLCFTLFNCKKNDNKYLTRIELIEHIASEDTKEYPSFASYYLFSSPNNRNELEWTNSYYLQKIYNHQSEFTQYRLFLISFFEKNIEIDCGLYECFTLNDTIKSTYEKSNIDTFLKYYSTKEKEYLRINSNLSQNARLSVMYYLSTNDYFSFYDDISGYYYTERIFLSSLEISNEEDNIFEK